MVKIADMLQAPIPGQSLTTTPRNYPWEKPPEMDEVEDVIKYYINRLADQDVMDDLAVIFEEDFPVSTFVKVLTTSGTMNGMHTIDAGTLAAPTIHAFVKAAMLSYGIEAKDNEKDPTEEKAEREKQRINLKIHFALQKAAEEERTAKTDPGVSLLQQMQEATGEEAPPQEDQPEVEETEEKGLMSKGME
jgi:hypothetical protein